MAPFEQATAQVPIAGAAPTYEHHVSHKESTSHV